MSFVIQNEAQAWELLRDAVGGRLDSDEFDLKFDNWPVLNIKFKGDQFNSSLTTKIMEGFIALQGDINRAYAKVKHGIPNANLLSVDEKKALEILVKVSPGSSDTSVNLQQTLETFVKEAVKTMKPIHIATIALGAGLMWAGTSCWNSYLDHQVEIKKLEIEAFADEQETERMDIMRKAIDSRHELEVVREDSVDFYNKVLKSAATAESVQITDREISQEEVKVLVKNTRTKPDEVRLDGACRVLAVNSSVATGFSVKVRHIDSGREFKAELNEDFLARKEKFKTLIQQAEWGKKPVVLNLNCREKRGEITQATIIGVEEYIEET